MFRRISTAESPLTKNKPATTISLPLPLPPQQPSNDDNKKHIYFTGTTMKTLSAMKGYMNSTRVMVLVVLCLQNSMFTTLRRYSQGVLKENYSKVRNFESERTCTGKYYSARLLLTTILIIFHSQKTIQYELLLVAEIIKLVYSAWMVQKNMIAEEGNVASDENPIPRRKNLSQELQYLVSTSRKMFVLALIYGSMNILSFISLRNISAGMFTIFSQTKILTTATFSTIILKRQYSWTKWRALIGLMMGVLLFSEPIWNPANATDNTAKNGNAFLGTVAVLIEVSLSGFASIYFEKVIKTDPLQLGIWERNFQLAMGSIPVYLVFIAGSGGGTAGFLQGWSPMAFLLAILGAAGGLLVALSIKHGDSILKTLATTGAIVLTGYLDYWFLNGPMSPSMIIAGVMVIISICNYTFDATPPTPKIEAESFSESPSKTTGRQASRNLLVAAATEEDTRNSSAGKETEQMLRKV